MQKWWLRPLAFSGAWLAVVVVVSILGLWYILGDNNAAGNLTQGQRCEKLGSVSGGLLVLGLLLIWGPAFQRSRQHQQALGNPTKKIRKVIFGILAVIWLLLLGGGIWAYSNGYYHALRGGMVQNQDVDKAIFFYKIAYEKNPDAFMLAHDIACCYALKGDNDACFHWLRLALKSSYADYAKEHAKTERDFASVRQTPEFRSLIYGASK
jgi:hypothetical protein